MGITSAATAVNGVEALQLIEARGGGDAFDVILMDLHMPLMAGMEVSQHAVMIVVILL